MKKKFSGKQVTQAGKDFACLEELVKDDVKFNHVMAVLSYWRLCHEYPLNIAWELLRTTVEQVDRNALFAKRLKRYVSIYNKLNRFPDMTLRSMQDIGGCRVILENKKQLDKSVRLLKKNDAFKTPSGRYRTKD